jgi:hypothetical protein
LAEILWPLQEIFLLAVLHPLQGGVQVVIDMRLYSVPNDLAKFTGRDRVQFDRAGLSVEFCGPSIFFLIWA